MVSFVPVAIAPFLFTLEIHYLAAHSSKIFKSLSGFMLLGKNANKKFSNAMVFKMKTSSFLKFLLVSSFNEHR